MCTCGHPIHIHVYVYMWPSNTCTCVCVHCLGAGGRLGVSSSLAAYVRKTAAVESVEEVDPREALLKYAKVCGGRVRVWGGGRGRPSKVCGGVGSCFIVCTWNLFC